MHHLHRAPCTRFERGAGKAMLQGHRSQSQRCCHVIGSRKVSTITDESGFPGDFRAQSLDDALEAIRSKQANKLLVCSFNEMKKSAGNVTIRSNQALSIAGRSDAGQDGPRLWVRFEVNGTLFGEGVTVRDQSISPSNATDPLQGAALLVLSRVVVCAVREDVTKRVNIFRVFFSTLLAGMAARCKTVLPVQI